MSQTHEPVVFGTDGIRGEAGAWPLVLPVAFAIGRALAAREGGVGARVLVVRDTRPSGAGLVSALLAGVASAGATALDGGVAPTAALAAALGAGVAEAGVMVTASHNPAGDNGFKVFGSGGRKLAADAQRRFEAELDAVLSDPLGASGPVGAVRSAAEPTREAWLGGLRRAFGDLGPLEGRHLVLDLAHGAASPLAEALAATLPCRVSVVGGGDGPINDRVGSQHPERLGAVVRELGADAGLAVDGDADRCVLVDASGAALPGDTLAWLLARRGPISGLAVTVMSSTALEASLPGVRVVRTPVGDQHLAAAMLAEGLALGVEESGHALFDDALPAGDGFVTGIRALCAAFAQGPSLAAVCAGFTPFPRAQSKVRVGARRPAVEDLAGVQAVVAGLPATLGPHGRALVRYSGTEPYLRLLVEGPDAAAVREVGEALRVAAERDLA